MSKTSRRRYFLYTKTFVDTWRHLSDEEQTLGSACLLLASATTRMTEDFQDWKRLHQWWSIPSWIHRLQFAVEARNLQRVVARVIGPGKDGKPLEINYTTLPKPTGRKSD